MKTSRKAGEFTRKVMLYTNDPEHRTEQLECVGKVLVPYKLTPRMANFGRLSYDAETTSETMTIERGDGDPLNLGEPVVEGRNKENITAELREIEPGEKYEVDIKLKPPWPNRIVRGQVKIDTGLDDDKQVIINVQARVVPRINPIPSTLYIPSPLRHKLQRNITLRWTGATGYKATGAECDVKDAVIQINDTDGQQHISVIFPEGYAAPARGGQFVHILTDDPKMPRVDVEIRAGGQGRHRSHLRKPISKPIPRRGPAHRAPEKPQKPAKSKENQKPKPK